MIEELLKPEIQAFIRANANIDIRQLALQKHKHSDWPFERILDQIQSRQKAKKKLPSWYRNQDVVFPPSISMEQCSSETTAKYKASLVEGGETVIDLTGGFGIDVLAFSEHFNEAVYVEQDQWLSTLANHNFRILGSKTEVINTSSEQMLDNQDHYDLIYMDPARRNHNAQKVIRLEDYSPNVLELLPKILEKSKQYMLKVSPLFDVKLGIVQLSGVEEVHVVSVKNEVKELLFIGSSDYSGEPTIIATNLEMDDDDFYFRFEEEEGTDIQYGSLSRYLYEPNSAIIKAGAFKSLAMRYGLTKLHPNTQLYSSQRIIEGFPGRSFKVNQELKLDKKYLKRLFPTMKANISIRNYPLTVRQIREKTGLKDGGGDYVFGLTDMTAKKLVLCEKF